MKKKTLTEIKIDMEPTMVEYENGYVILEPLNALDFMELAPKMIDEPTTVTADIFRKCVVEAKWGDFEWKRGMDFETLLRNMPASIYNDLVIEALSINNLLPDQQRFLSRVEEIQEKK